MEEQNYGLMDNESLQPTNVPQIEPVETIQEVPPMRPVEPVVEPVIPDVPPVVPIEEVKEPESVEPVIQSGPIEPTPPVEQEKKTGDKMWKALAGVFALIAIVLGFLLLTKKDPITVVFVDEENNIRLEKINKGSKIESPMVGDEDFLGWYDGENKFDFTKGIDKDSVLYAKYDTSNQFTITFDTDGGSKIDAVKVKENRTVSIPTQPTKNGYLFNEWTLNGKVYDFSTPVTSDITLKATWRIDDNTVMVRFDSAGGSAVSSQKVPIGGNAKKPGNPSKSCANFVEWQLDGKAYDFTTTVTSDITLKATWTDKKKVTLSFNSNGGSSVASKQVCPGEAVGSLPSPTKSGFYFSKWTLNGNTFNSNSRINGNATVVAVWKTLDQHNLDVALSKIANSYTITKDGQQISVSGIPSGCTVTHDPIKTTNKEIVFHVTCGTEKQDKKAKAVVKLPTYSCTFKASGNMIDSIFTIKGVKEGHLRNTNNQIIAKITDGTARPTDFETGADRLSTINLKMTITGDSTTYNLTCKKAG